MRRLLSIVFLLCVCLLSRGQTALYNYRYWFDQSSAVYTGISTDPKWNFEADVSSLKEGLHSISIQIERDDTLSSPRTYLFVKTPLVENLENMECLFWVDGKLFRDEQIPSTNGTMAWTIDVSSLTEGLHQYMVQVVMPGGVCSDIREGTFMYSTQGDELDSMKCYYMVDGANASTVEATTISNGLYHFDLDVSSLSDGLHNLSYWLVGSNGSCTTIKTAYFTKVPIGGSGITEFQYWLNDLDDQKHITTYEPRQDTVSIISLLPVETQPIRSCNFQFALKNGEPLIYAKNELHFRFTDAGGRSTEVVKEYVDEQVSEAVTPVGELQTTQTFPKVGNNEIRWYTVNVAPGDSVAFKSSLACTIQLFSPSGKEVYNASGSSAVAYGGIHTWEDGTYYLAVHDVTGTQSQMTINYMHMDKYDVVEWDVHTVGNGGCSTITFNGNGFRDLYALDLYNAQGDSLHSVDVSYINDAESRVTFDFTDVDLGTYNAVFRFVQGDVVVSNAITVEEPIDIALETEVSFPSSFRHGGSTTYTIKITNKGNMTAYSVPIYTWIMNKWKKDAIYHIKYDGLDLPGIFDGVDMDSLSVAERAELQALSKEMGDGHYFMLFHTEDEDSPGDSVWVRSNYFFSNIAPYETKTLKLTISADEGVWAYFTVPEDWLSFSSEQIPNGAMYAKARFKSSSLKDKFCCVKEKRECVLTLLNDATGLLSALVSVIDMCIPPAALQAKGFSSSAALATSVMDCVISGINSSSKVLDEYICEGAGGGNLGDLAKQLIENAGQSILSSFLTCASAKFSILANKKYLKDSYRRLYDVLSKGLTSSSNSLANSNFSCLSSFTEPIPGCPPNSDGGGGNSQGGYSHDPNEIYGYLSESGSKFLADSVARVNYTIEFENDTALATASAHTIVIRDTLDSRYFDLKTFAPMSVKIGSHTELLDGKPQFVKTIDMRPEINAIAQVTGEYDEKKGIATWTFQSLDPMTMEPTDDLMQGILPVNYDGNSGIGEVLFEIGVKTGKGDGTEVCNRASIVFDYEEPILTPTWMNIVDAVPPTSCVVDGSFDTDSTIVLNIQSEDNRSGIWYYNVYAQQGKLAPWIMVAEHVTGPQCTVTCFEDIEYGFCVLATDSAGNVERKELTRELSLEEDIETALTETIIDNGSNATYDLNGRKMEARRPGIYIRRGKKSLVKP